MCQALNYALDFHSSQQAYEEPTTTTMNFTHIFFNPHSYLVLMHLIYNKETGSEKLNNLGQDSLTSK